MRYNRALQASTAMRQASQAKPFLAPSRGWIRNENLAKAKAGGAEVMDNWFPTPEGCRMRRGTDKHGEIAEAVTHLTTYVSGAVEKMFATDADAIYDVTSPVDPDTPPAASVSGQSNGDWSSVQMTLAAGTSVLVMVNGADDMQQFDGSSWVTINAGSTPAITGVNTNTLRQVWKYSSRLWFIGSGMNAWYLGALARSGAATAFPLGGVFNLGGSLMFGQAWSADTGEGLDDFCLFVTDQGEVAVYQGDPASTFVKVGVYRIGKPIHKNAFFRAGGDVAIITDDGIVSMSAAIQQRKDQAALIASAVTYDIEEAWRLAVTERNSGLLPFTCVIWPSKTMLVIGIPASGSQRKITYVANTRTGAWCRYTGWDIRCMVVFNNHLYFGTRDGSILDAEVTGADLGAPYSAVVVPKFTDFGSPAEKSALHCRIIAKANNPFTPQLFATADYEVEIPPPLNADSDENENTWDNGIWNQSTWGSAFDTKARRSEWQAVAANGQALAPGLQVTSGRTTAPDVELVALHLMVETGEVMA